MAAQKVGPAQRGSITAEIAVCLPALAFVLGIALTAVEATAAHIACTDAARIGARALARGDRPHTVRSLTMEAAPSGADVELSHGSDYARVTVSASVRLFHGAELFQVSSRAATPLEAR